MIAALASSRLGAWCVIHLLSPLDRVVLRLTKGRVSVSLGIPILLLTTIGARSGRRRSTPLLYIIDSDQFAVIASRGGSAHHPAWYLNLRANPQVTVLARGREMDCAARDAAGEERERLWQLALKAFEGYQVYRQRAGDREIPVVVLTPRPSF